MTTADDRRVKVLIPLPEDSDHGLGAENLWAESVADGAYRVRNIPTWAYELSLDDVIEAHEAEDGRLTLDRVVRRGGHSTYRIIPDAGTDEATFLARWAPLHDAGCTYESHSDRARYAVDVSPEANIHKVYALLHAGEDDGVWEFEEGHCGHPVDGQQAAEP